MGRLNKYQLGFVLIFMLIAIGKTSAQTSDSTIGDAFNPNSHKAGSTFKNSKKLTKYNKAALMSAVIPGLGQIGHHDSWRHVPIIYAGFVGLGYSIVYNNTVYKQYLGYYRSRLSAEASGTVSNSDPYISSLSDAGLLSDVLQYRRYRDLSIIGICVWYLANIVDAYVGAQLRDIDINNNLSLNVLPLNIALIGNQPALTCGLKFNLK